MKKPTANKPDIEPPAPPASPDQSPALPVPSTQEEFTCVGGVWVPVPPPVPVPSQN